MPRVSRRRMLLAAAAALIAMLVAAVVVMTVFTAFTLSTVRQTQLDNTARDKTVKQLAERIESCTTPEGECARESRERTAGAVGGINEVTILVAICGVDLTPAMSLEKRTARIRPCVERLLAKQ